MEKIETLIDIAEKLGLSNIVSELQLIELRSKQENAKLILPLVGEFSSGKTSLINALTDSKKLETATKPTTATIYEVHFCSDSIHAKVVSEDGTIKDISDIAELKNDELKDAKIVTVFDTSCRVPATTVLVDTPGLSSPDPKHKQTLMDCLPKADGILLVTDINQQITRSLTDFIETMKLSNLPIFLVLTKSDTKSSNDIESVKNYISENCKIPLEQIAVVSAKTGSLDELETLLDRIQKNKKNILEQVDGQRTKNIIGFLTKHIDELMSASNSDKDLDEAISQCNCELDKIKRNINSLVDDMSEDIEKYKDETARKFDSKIYERLLSLVNNQNSNLDTDAMSIINNTATILMNEYKVRVKNSLREKANSRKGNDDEIPLYSLESIDLSSIQMPQLGYTINLDTMGHEYDGMIKVGLTVAAVVGTACVVGPVVAEAAGGGVATAAGGAAATTAGEAAATTAAGAVTAGKAAASGASKLGTLLDGIDTISDALSIYSNKKTVEKLENAANNINNNTSDCSVPQSVPQVAKQGMVDSFISSVTNCVLSVPQRRKAVRDYVEYSVVPEFKNHMVSITDSLKESIRCNLNNEASDIIEQKTNNLKQLQQERKDKKDSFDKQMEQLREYKSTLSKI